MGKKQDVPSASSVSTDEGTNYAGQRGGFSEGLKETDKQYLSTLLAPQSTGRRESSQPQVKNPIIGNYYGSMIGNVPLFAAQGVSLPIDSIDDLYQKNQLRRYAQLQQDAIKIPAIAMAKHNEVFYNNYKSYIDHIYKQAVARFNGDSNKARLWMRQDEGVQHVLTQGGMVADEWNQALATIKDILKNKDSANFITPTAVKKYSKLLNNAKGEDGKTEVDRSFIRDEKTGEVIGMDFSKTAELISSIQRLPSIFSSTSKMAEKYKSVIQGNMDRATFGNSSNDAFVAWKNTNKDFDNWTEEEVLDPETGNKVKRRMPPKLDQMTDAVMESEYYILDPKSDEYDETRQIVRESLNLQVQRMTEAQYQVLSSREGEKKLAISQLAMGKGTAQVLNPRTGLFESQEVDNYIAHQSKIVYDNASRVGIRSGNMYNSTNYPGDLVEVLENSVSFSVADDYNRTVVIDPSNVRMIPTTIADEVNRLFPNVVDFANKLVKGKGVKVDICESNVILHPYTGGSTSTVSGRLSTEDKDKYKLVGRTTESTTQQTPKNFKIRLHHPDGTTEDVDQTTDLNIITLAAETAKVTPVNEPGYGYLLEDEFKRGKGRSARLTSRVTLLGANDKTVDGGKGQVIEQQEDFMGLGAYK